MLELLFDSPMPDADRRAQLYSGNLFMYSPGAATNALCEFGRRLIEEAFDPLDPRTAQHSLVVDDFAAILAELKPRFIHHPTVKTLLRDILLEHNCDLDKTYFDVPRLRSSTSDGYLTSGIAYAFHPHRDVWYSAPLCQINWWMPVYPMPRSGGMVFHPNYWQRSVKNGSAGYNYARWNETSRFNAAQHVRKDTRVQPKPEEPLVLDGDIQLVGAPASMVLFSGAQLHSSAENLGGETRYSIDFRTVHLDDVVEGKGAPNVDSACTGTTMGDYLRGSDYEHLPDEWIQKYDQGWGR